jgi:CheY-like chemotaxis protein
MDILMPHMDGIAATRELRRRGFTVPVVALTAGGAGTALEALEAGMDDYALKPVPRKLLWDLVAQWTGYDGAVSPPQDEADRLSMEEAFAAELPLIRTALRRAWVAGNEEEARILAERLGSSAAQCGRDDLKRLAEEMEEALGEGRSAEPLMARLFEGEERF